MKKTILITGAAGFIGSNVCQKLLELKNLVIGVDNFNKYYSPKIKNGRVTILKNNPNFIFYQVSVLDQKTIVDIAHLHKPQVIIHAAAEVGVRNSQFHPFEYWQTNVLGTHIILDAVKKYIKHAVVLSSSSVYGNSTNLPFSENEYISINNPVSVYGFSKTALEMVTASFHKQTGIPTTVVRPFSVYGPDGRPDMLPMKMLISSLLNKSVEIYGLNRTQRDWSYIDDVASAIVEISNKSYDFSIVNVGLGKPIKTSAVIKMAQKIINGFGYSLKIINKPLIKNEMVKTSADTKKLNVVYGVKMTTGFEDGFKKTADYFFAHKDIYL
jgi:UDP-glucuronate 4-epimerase